MKGENLLVHSLLDRKVIPSHAQSLGRGDRMSPEAQAKGRMPGGNDPQDPRGARGHQGLVLHCPARCPEYCPDHPWPFSGTVPRGWPPLFHSVFCLP